MTPAPASQPLPLEYVYSGVLLAPAQGETLLPLTTSEGNSIPYVNESHIHVYTSQDDFQTYTELSRPGEWDFDTSGTQVRLVNPVGGSFPIEKYVIRRLTPVDEELVFYAGSLLTAEKLDLFKRLCLFRDQELRDQNVLFDELVRESSIDSEQARTIAEAASSQVGDAVNAANSAQSIASTALGDALAADAKATEAASKADQAKASADAALAAVSSAVVATLVDDVPSIPSSPDDGDIVKVANSAGIESFTPLQGLPPGFVGDPGLSVTIQYSQGSATWQWVRYEPNDPDSRYWVAKDASLTEKGIVQLSSATDLDSEDRAATPKAVKTVADELTTTTADATTAKALAENALPRTGGVMEGPITWSPGQAFPQEALPEGTILQKGIVQLTSDLTGSSETLVPHQAAVAGLRTTALSASAAAQTAADNAQTAADSAQSKADSASTAAALAQAKADEAYQLAGQVSAGKNLLFNGSLLEAPVIDNPTGNPFNPLNWYIEAADQQDAVLALISPTDFAAGPVKTQTAYNNLVSSGYGDAPLAGVVSTPQSAPARVYLNTNWKVGYKFLMGKQLTFSIFLAANDIQGNSVSGSTNLVVGKLANSFGTRTIEWSVATSPSKTVNGQFQRHSVTFTIPSVSYSQWAPFELVCGYNIFGYGSSFPGQSLIYAAGAQLELGSTATTLEYTNPLA